MTAYCRRAWFPSLVVLFVLGCSNGSSSSSQGCGSNATDKVCDIQTMATTCPGEITLECSDGAVPDAKSRCKVAIQQDTQTVYCCGSLAEADGAGGS